MRTQQGQFLADSGAAIYSLQSDWRWLVNTLAYVNPTQPLAPASLTALGQAYATGTTSSGTVTNQRGYYVWPVGVDTAEAAIKNLITANLVTRLGRPVTVLPNLNRGGNARTAGMLPDVRFQTVAEAIEPLLEWSGLVLDVWQDWDTPTVYMDVREPGEFSQTITRDSGLIVGGSWVREAPDATRVVAGGPGEEAARAFTSATDPGLETEWGDVIEVFRDATGANLKWPDALAENLKVAKYYLLRGDVLTADKTEFTAYLNEATREALAEGRPVASLDVELVENDALSLYGENGLHLGDKITASSDGVTITGTIDEADITFSRDGGQRVTPIVGKRSDDDDTALWDAISGLDRALRNITRKR